jgi:predicted dehydrogenase
MTSSFDEVLESDVDAVVLATPVSTHFGLAVRALQAGKHVLVEKPLATRSVEAREMACEAEDRGLTLMVGHTFVYNPAVQLVREVVQSGELGEVYYINGNRLNLGLFQPDINVLWDLAPHDVSILLYLLGVDPELVSARGGAYVQRQRGIHDVAHLSMRFPDQVLADVRVSWLDPVKSRTYTIVGSKKMLVYDDLSDNEKVVLYDKRVEIPPYTDTEEAFRASYHHGDEGVALPINWTEPLRNECEQFLACVNGACTSLSDARTGAKVVQILEAADRSMHNGGSWEEWQCQPSKAKASLLLI